MSRKSTRTIKRENAFSMDGNNGGDYFTIREAGEGRVLVEVGHCCAVFVRHLLPIEVLTATLAEAWNEKPQQRLFTGKYGDKLNAAVKRDTWPF